MYEHPMDTLSEAIQTMRKEGYRADFNYDDNALVDQETGKKYNPGDLKIVDHFRFEGISDPDDMSVLYILEANDGTKGLLSSAFGVYMDNNLGSFIEKIPHK